MTDDEQVPETEQPQSINKAQLRGEARNLIDIGIQSGLDPEDVESVFRDLADGVEYYYEDASRYTQQDD